MKVFYERLSMGNATSTTPWLHCTSLAIEPPVRERAAELATASMHLFDFIRPQQNSEAKFAEEVLHFAAAGSIRIIPELCDEEGRELASQVKSG